MFKIWTKQDPHYSSDNSARNVFIFFLFFKLSEDEEEGDDNLNEFIEENFGKLCVMTDDDLFAQIESDESFSLELLDREIREAGLDPPSWWR